MNKGLATRLTFSTEHWILVAMTILVMMTNADYTAVNLALVSISKTFHAPISYVQWIFSGYNLVWAACSIPAGKLTDYLGYNRSTVLGVSVFGIGSLLSGIAPWAWFLIAARVVQALGAAISIPAIYGIIVENIEYSRQKQAFGLMSTGIAMGLIIGPSLGGLLIHILSWRLIFFINLPICLFILYVFLTKHHPKKVHQEKPSLDYLNLSLFVISIVSFVFLLNKMSLWGLGSFKTLFLFWLSITFLTLFFMFQGKNKDPILRIDLFKIKSFLRTNLLYVIFMFDFVFALIIFGLYLQNMRGFSAFDAGLIFLSFTGTYAGIEFILPKILKHFSITIVTVVEEILVSICFLAVLTLTSTSSLGTIIALLACFGIALGLLFPTFNTEMASSLPENLVGEGSGIFLMMGLIASSVFTVFSIMILNDWLSHQFFNLLSTTQLLLTAAQKSSISLMLFHARLPLDFLMQLHIQYPEQYIRIFHASFAYAMHRLAWIGVVLNLSSLLIIKMTASEMK